MSKPLVICAFPGCGKTYYKNITSEVKKEIVYDVDTADFYIDIETGLINRDFPKNLIDHVENLYSNPHIDIIFVSALEPGIYRGLQERNISFCFIIPESNECNKKEWLRRLEKYQTEDFIMMLDTYWNSWLNEVDQFALKHNISYVKLNYLNTFINSNVIDRLKNPTYKFDKDLIRELYNLSENKDIFDFKKEEDEYGFPKEDPCKNFFQFLLFSLKIYTKEELNETYNKIFPGGV